jgi:hypothetical protein
MTCVKLTHESQRCVGQQFIVHVLFGSRHVIAPAWQLDLTLFNDTLSIHSFAERVTYHVLELREYRVQHVRVLECTRLRAKCLAPERN